MDSLYAKGCTPAIKGSACYGTRQQQVEKSTINKQLELEQEQEMVRRQRMLTENYKSGIASPVRKTTDEVHSKLYCVR